VKRSVLLSLIAAVIVLLALPLALTDYYLGLVIRMMIFSIFAMSLDLLMGYAGLASLGHSAFLGVAAYAVGILSVRVSNSLFLTLGAGLGLAGITAALFGFMVLRSRGPQFLMLTLALAQVLWGIAFKWKAVTGGDDGLPGIPRPSLWLLWDLADLTGFYYFSLIFFLVAALLLYLIVRSPFGYTLEGIRENETRMRTLGYHVWIHQYIAFVLAGLFGGMAGVLFAYFNRFVSPAELHLATSAKVLLMVVLGGAGTLFGPALGAAIVVLLENLISAYTQRWLTILGAIYVLVVLFMRQGLWGPVRKGV
jgi:branched-chain amino acid transport system permease protein